MKVFFYLKRLEGLSREEFRDHMENIHIPIAEKYFVHLIHPYSRYYFGELPESHPLAGYDCISEWTLESEEVFDDIMTNMETRADIREDEDKFLDLPACFFVKCPSSGIAGDNASGAIPYRGSRAD